jgi:hypothetical protein
LTAAQLDGLALFTKATDNVAKVGDGHGWISPPHTHPIRIDTTRPGDDRSRDLRHPPSTNSSTPLM